MSKAQLEEREEKLGAFPIWRSSQHEISLSNFVLTKEYRRFAEFCDACRRYHCIGIWVVAQSRMLW
jgi:hypothetical protein